MATRLPGVWGAWGERTDTGGDEGREEKKGDTGGLRPNRLRRHRQKEREGVIILHRTLAYALTDISYGKTQKKRRGNGEGDGEDRSPYTSTRESQRATTGSTEENGGADHLAFTVSLEAVMQRAMPLRTVNCTLRRR